MFDFLPAAEVMVLRRAPLRQVIAQVRFESQSALGTHQGAARVHEVLVDDYPRMLTEQQQVFTMTSAGGVSTVTHPQFRLTDLEQSWSVVMGSEHVTLETNAYSSWTVLRERLEAALAAVGSITKLRIRERIGLRYVNHVASDANGMLTDRIRPELLGPASEPAWKQGVDTMISQVVATDGTAQLLLRYGLADEQSHGRVGFFIDIDSVDSAPVGFSMSDTMSYFDRLNDVGYRCFCWCVPEAHRKQLTTGDGG
ncbi:TIGR04255 family protein [Sinosporangium album]|uniref:TIGR04255 family protein n=1 Tax=Sinosporangium album TaxID=504805 RepID=A0A1G7S938_9ACTN|nr:TIGR04255 family protein [Sinosporangium album]SDG19565.1 TIGR04255 family protein [Sinosporangium album]